MQYRPELVGVQILPQARHERDVGRAPGPEQRRQRRTARTIQRLG
jgi:hypothetical protein